jgi:thiamine-phosphate pyrophosphorylase
LNTEPLHGLYAITDAQLLADSHFVEGVTQALEGGARIIQYRDKSHQLDRRLNQARALRTICTRHHALLIINDDVALAKQVHADGVHLGLDDSGIAQARAQLGADSLIGISCYNRFELAERAAFEGADYIAFGAFYDSPTKPAAVKAGIDLITRAKQQLDIPVCTIGGITLENAAPLVQAGADMLAVISGVFAARDITAQARHFSGLWDEPELI